MNDILIILAISVIILGFLMLVGLALWLAAERRRARSAVPYPPRQPLASQPVAQPQRPVAPEAADEDPTVQLRRPAASPAAAAPAESQAGSAAPAESKPQKDLLPSGEYPSAALYDQTLLPPPPKRRTRPQTK
jgi:dienelactone hydrolase